MQWAAGALPTGRTIRRQYSEWGRSLAPTFYKGKIMATKTQMESTIESLTGQVALLKEKLLQAGAEIAHLRRPKINESKTPKTCINCGQGQAPIQATQTGYKCPSCGHEWNDEHERAAFRRG